MKNVIAQLPSGTKKQLNARLVGSLDPWPNQIHGEIVYFLTQLLSGHGDFQSRLHKIGKAEFLDCMFCNGVADDDEQMSFSCEFYADTWKLSPDNVVREKLRGAGR